MEQQPHENRCCEGIGVLFQVWQLGGSTVKDVLWLPSLAQLVNVSE
jgi:hypothetical protein